MASSTAHFCVLMALVLGRTALSKECGRLPNNHQECLVYRVSSEGTVCDLMESSQRELSFFVKPGHQFRGIQVSFSGTKLYLEAEHFGDADKWYEIKVWKDAGLFLSDYYISVVGKITRKTTSTNSGSFKVTVKGSLSYSEQCNPDSFKEHHEVGPTPHFLTNVVKFDEVAPDNNSRPAHASENEVGDDSILGYPIWIFIIAGLAVTFLLIATLATIFVMKRKKRAEKKLRSHEKGNCSDNAASNHHLRRTGSLQTASNSRYGLEDSTSLIYEEPGSSPNGDHAYENAAELRQEDLQNQEQNPSTDAWRVQYHMTNGQSRRPSAHDSENSLYGCVIDRTN